MGEISSTGDQMLAVMETIARDGPITIIEIASSHGVNRTVVHRLVATLHKRGYVTRLGNRFVLGPAISRLRSASVYAALQTAAAPILHDMAAQSNETMVLHGIDGTDAVVLDQVESPRQVVRARHFPGSRHALDRGASGLAILAFRPSTESANFSGLSDGPDAFAQQLTEIRARGFAISLDELQQGVHGLAVPVRDPTGDCIASLAIIVPVQRSDGLIDKKDWLLAGRDEIETRLAVGQAVRS